MNLPRRRTERSHRFRNAFVCVCLACAAVIGTSAQMTGAPTAGYRQEPGMVAQGDLQRRQVPGLMSKRDRASNSAAVGGYMKGNLCARFG